MNSELIDAVELFGIIGAVVFLLFASVYLGFYVHRWIKNAEHPRERVRLLITTLLKCSLIHGVGLICVGGGFFSVGTY